MTAAPTPPVVLVMKGPTPCQGTCCHGGIRVDEGTGESTGEERVEWLRCTAPRSYRWCAPSWESKGNSDKDILLEEATRGGEGGYAAVAD